MKGGWKGYCFTKRLHYVKSKLEEWNKVSFRDLKETKKNILKDLAIIDAHEQEENLSLELLTVKAIRKGE